MRSQRKLSVIRRIAGKRRWCPGGGTEDSVQEVNDYYDEAITCAGIVGGGVTYTQKQRRVVASWDCVPILCRVWHR